MTPFKPMSSEKRRPSSMFFIPALLCSLLFLSACGGCPKAQKAWDAAKAVPAQSKLGPHWMLEVQTKEVRSKLMSARKGQKFSKTKLRLKSPVGGIKLAPIKFELSDFHWVVNGNQGVLKVKVSALMKKKEILTLTLRGDSPLHLDKKAKKLRLQVKADQFKKASLRLGDGAEKALKKAVMRQIPKELRGFIPKKELVKFVKKALKIISDEGYPMIRKNILSPLGTIAKLEWALPNYPISKMAINVSDDVWRIGLWTDIKADGLGKKAMKRGIGKNQAGARLLISAPWVAAAGNWAMSTGKLPSKFDRNGQPSKKGKAKARMTWKAGQKVKRPLKIHLWAGTQKRLDLCLYARAGINPRLKISDGTLKMNAEGKLERVEGNPLVKTAVNLSGVGERTLQWHHQSSKPSAMNIGGSNMPLRWLNVSLNRDYVMVGIDLGGQRAEVQMEEVKAVAVAQALPAVP
jgi:hypothetical protein